MDAKDIDAHPIHSTLSQLRAARDRPELLDIAPESSNAWMLQKVFQFLELVRFRLDATPRTLISVTGLTSLNNALAAVLTELTNYKANPSPSYLENAVNHVDQTAMNSLWAIPGQATQEGKAELGQIANAFYEQVQAILSKIEAEKAELQERLDETVRQVREQAEQIKESDRQIAQQKADAAAISAELKRDFTVIDQEFRTKFGTMSDEQKAAHVAQLSDERTAADLLVAELAKKRDEAADIVQIVGNIGVTGNYQKIALEQASQADNWRLVTFGVFAVAAAFGAYTLMEFGKATIDWTAALVRNGIFVRHRHRSALHGQGIGTTSHNCRLCSP